MRAMLASLENNLGHTLFPRSIQLDLQDGSKLLPSRFQEGIQVGFAQMAT